MPNGEIQQVVDPRRWYLPMGMFVSIFMAAIGATWYLGDMIRQQEILAGNRWTHEDQVHDRQMTNALLKAFMAEMKQKNPELDMPELQLPEIE